MTTKKKKAPRARPVETTTHEIALDYQAILGGLLPAILGTIESGNRLRAASGERADQHIERLDQLLTQQAALIRDLALAK